MEHFNYRTGKVQGNNIFDTSRFGVPYYDDFLSNPKYMENVKNRKLKIVEMTPKSYLEECAKIFGKTFQDMINQIEYDKEIVDYLKKVILDFKEQFPLTFLDYANNTQEGRHRMYVAGELFGWNTKFPVAIIEVADKAREEELKREAYLNKIANYINEAHNKTLYYSYNSITDYIEEFEYQIKKLTDEPITISAKDSNIVVRYDNGDEEILYPIEEIEFKDEEEDDEDDLSFIDDLSEKELEDLLNSI